MNEFNQNYHSLLRQFEALNRDGVRETPLQFINALSFAPPHDFQLEVVAVDTELSLSKGIKPSLQSYLDDFPHLSDAIPEVYLEVVTTFVKNFCPVTRSLGKSRSTPDYEIGEEIDRGGMGVVYRALQKTVKREVALKVLFLARDDIFMEARKTANLNHRNICRIYDAGTIGDFPYMAMQLVRGTNLKLRLAQGRLSVAESIGTVIQVANALAEAHASNLAHLDVKPENIVTAVDGHTWLMDFGLAKKQSELLADVSGLHPLSPAYGSPEQLDTRFGECGIRSDIYSLGLVLYELLTGRRAYGGSVAQIIEQLEHDPPRRPTDYDSTISPELEAICLKAIEKQPGDRYASITEFREALTLFAFRSGIDIGVFGLAGAKSGRASD